MPYLTVTSSNPNDTHDEEETMSALRNDVTDDLDRTAAESSSQSSTDLVGYPPPPADKRAAVKVESSDAEAVDAPLIWAVSAHGGAGAQALASRIGFVADSGSAFPSGSHPGEDHVVICAEETLSGIIAAHHLVLQHLNGLAGDTRLLAVVTRPARPGWEGKKLPKPIRNRLELLKDPNLVGTVIRLSWDDELAITTADEREALSPEEVIEWLGMDTKARAKAAKAKNTLAWLGLTAAAAELLSLAAAATAEAADDSDDSTDTDEEDN